MLKKIMLVSVAALFLTACSNGSEGGGIALSDAQVANIKAITTATCSFFPTAISIAAALPATAPYAVPASVIAQAICDAITKQGLARDVLADTALTTKINVNGKETNVTFTGHFIRTVK